jgi:hypothetical protein
VDRQRLLHDPARILARERLGHARLPRIHRISRTMGHDDVRQIEELMPAAPRREIEESVGAQQQHERPRSTELLPQFQQRVHGVAGAGAPDFALVEMEQRIALDRQPDHGGAVLRTRAGRTAMRRGSRRNEAHFLELQRFPDLLRQPQVAIVDGIEGAAEYADRRGRHESTAQPERRAARDHRRRSWSLVLDPGGHD